MTLSACAVNREVYMKMTDVDQKNNSLKVLAL